MDIQETVEARKEKIVEQDAWNILKESSEIIVGKGKKFQIFDPSKDAKEDILAASLGRTGNLRAPALKIGKRFIIGFNEDMYKQFVG